MLLAILIFEQARLNADIKGVLVKGRDHDIDGLALDLKFGTEVACSRRSDSRAREKNSGRKKKRGETRGGKGEKTPVNIPLQSSFRP